ncbi:MAG: hypothetical protein JKY71_08610 [Alphaproteobacteria bacterium]|nr:hypothetical protein [Alphaproteobacteria bacterium]
MPTSPIVSLGPHVNEGTVDKHADNPEPEQGGKAEDNNFGYCKGPE